jgi:hypothetical protein
MPITVEVTNSPDPNRVTVKKVEIVHSSKKVVVAQIHTRSKYPVLGGLSSRSINLDVDSRVTFNGLPFEPEHPIAMQDRHVIAVVFVNPELFTGDMGNIKVAYDIDNPKIVWTREDDHAGKGQGWALFDNHEEVELWHLAEPELVHQEIHGEGHVYTGPKFNDDDEALAAVQKSANEGDELCRKVILYLIQQGSPSVEYSGLKTPWLQESK